MPSAFRWGTGDFRGQHRIRQDRPLPVQHRAGQAQRRHRSYKVTIEKEDNLLQLFINDMLLVRKYYTLPVKVERSSKFGFYTWNSCLAIDDLRTARRRCRCRCRFVGILIGKHLHTARPCAVDPVRQRCGRPQLSGPSAFMWLTIPITPASSAMRMTSWTAATTPAS